MMYTMQSEREIHNQMTQASDVVDEKNNDEVEFFNINTSNHE